MLNKNSAIEKIQTMKTTTQATSDYCSGANNAAVPYYLIVLMVVVAIVLGAPV
jgi:hypothetical protein